MGSLAAWFALGIVLFSLPAGASVRRLGAKRTLLACLAGYAVSVAVFPWLSAFPALAAARFFDGAFSVGVWVSCETILLLRAPRGMKALVTSLYAISIAIGYVLGPLAARALVAFAPRSLAFAVSGALALLAFAVVAFQLDDGAARAPSDEKSGSSSLRAGLRLFFRIKTSCFATFAYGYFQASVVLFLPLYLAHEKHIEEGRTIIIPAFFAAGMLAFSNVAGRLGDRFGHLLVMRALGSIGLVMVLGFVFLDSYPLMCAAVTVAGATLASISPVSLALQGVVAEAPELSRSNAIYNAFYAAGMLVGPALSGLLFERFGGARCSFTSRRSGGPSSSSASSIATTIRPVCGSRPVGARRRGRGLRWCALPAAVATPSRRSSSSPAPSPAEISLEDSLHAVTEVALDLVPGDHASVRLLDGAKSSLLSGARSGRGAAERPLAFNRSEGLLGWVVEHRQPLSVTDVEKDPPSSPTRGRASRFNRCSPSRSGPGATSSASCRSHRPSATRSTMTTSSSCASSQTARYPPSRTHA